MSFTNGPKEKIVKIINPKLQIDNMPYSTEERERMGGEVR